MNPGIELILGRRSIRKYKKDKISEDTLEALLKAAMAAPSARAVDPWRFVVIRSIDQLKALAAKLPSAKMIADAPMGIAVCGDINAANDRQLSYMLQDCSAAIENLLIAAHGLGLGACWLGVHPRQDRMAHVTKVLELPEGIIPVCCIAVGYPDEQKEPRTRHNPEYVHYEKWCRGWRR
jgi:nitroreductase